MYCALAAVSASESVWCDSISVMDRLIRRISSILSPLSANAELAALIPASAWPSSVLLPGMVSARVFIIAVNGCWSTCSAVSAALRPTSSRL